MWRRAVRGCKLEYLGGHVIVKLNNYCFTLRICNVGTINVRNFASTKTLSDLMTGRTSYCKGHRSINQASQCRHCFMALHL